MELGGDCDASRTLEHCALLCRDYTSEDGNQCRVFIFGRADGSAKGCCYMEDTSHGDVDEDCTGNNRLANTNYDLYKI